MDAHRGRQSLIRMYLVRSLLLLTVSTAICNAQQEPEILDEMSPGCISTEGDQGLLIECSNITNFSDVTSTLTSADEKVATLSITKSPLLVLQRSDLDNPAFKELELLHWTRSEKTSFDPEPLQGLAKLEKLSLRGNNLHSIAADTFAGLTNLRELNLGENNIDSIEAGAFKILKNLDRLDLSSNQLTSIPSGLFEGTTIPSLNLNYNQLTGIEEGSFQGLANVTNIVFIGNKIKNIDSKAFQSLVNLALVDLSKNQLEGIDIRLFENNPLIALNLHENNLENIANFQLNHSSLHGLRMSNCNIQTLPVDFFNNLPGLILLNIERNNITTIPPGLLTPLTNLRVLEMNNNKLTSLSTASFSQLHNLIKAVANKETFRVLEFQMPSQIKMTDNPWDCSSSDMIEIRAWCEHNGVVFDDLFICNISPAPVLISEPQN